MFDAVLTDAALESLQEFALQATVFQNVKDGYLGAYRADGFVPPVLAQVAEEVGD